MVCEHSNSQEGSGEEELFEESKNLNAEELLERKKIHQMEQENIKGEIEQLLETMQQAPKNSALPKLEQFYEEKKI